MIGKTLKTIHGQIACRLQRCNIKTRASILIDTLLILVANYYVVTCRSFITCSIRIMTEVKDYTV